MREREHTMLAYLSREGIATHGTNLSRAKAILANGFNPGTYYTIQPPTNTVTRYIIDDMYDCIASSLQYAHRASSYEKYAWSQGQEDKIGALVIFKPLKPAKGLRAYSDFEEYSIPKKNMIGILEVQMKKYPEFELLDDPEIKKYLHTTRKHISDLVREKGLFPT